jgi:acetyltransferase-like isoleucine patch superfamily enzyme
MPLSEPGRHRLAGVVFWRFKQATSGRHSRARRAWFIARARLHAYWQRAELTIEIAPNVKLGKGCRVSLRPHTRNTIRIGASCTIGERALLELNGGEIVLGDWVTIDRNPYFTASGRLVLAGRNRLRENIVIHCDEAITLKPMVGMGEGVSIIDSTHYFTEPDEWFADNLKTGPVEIGINSWIGAKATIVRNVTVGDFCIVGANSLLATDVPNGHLVSGVPAIVVRRVHLPWLGDAGALIEPEELAD